MTYIMQDQVGMILRIKWVCFEKAEPRSTDQLHAKLRASAKDKNVIKNLTAIEYLTYTTMPKNQQINKASEV